METTPPDGIEYWARLSTFINNNPVHERDRFFMAMLKPLGIEKGKPFNPMRANARSSRRRPRSATQWRERCFSMPRSAFSGRHGISRHTLEWVVLMDADQETATYSQLDERLHYFYGAIYMSPAIGVKKAGPGAQYIQAFRDTDGNRFDGGKSYRLRVPGERAGVGLLVADAVRH